MTSQSARPLKLPAANEFTPGQLGGSTAVYALLGAVGDLSGERAEIVEFIRGRWFSKSAMRRSADPGDQLEQQRKRATNVITGMQQYDLLEPGRSPLVLSELGLQVYELRDSPEVGLSILAKHLLHSKYGLELLLIAGSLPQPITNEAVADALAKSGYEIPTHTTNHSKLRAWLGAAGLINDKWVVDQAVLKALSGTSAADVRLWERLTPVQRDVILSLRVRDEGNQTPIQSSDLLELLRQRGTTFDPGQVKKTIYAPLTAAGLIQHTVKEGGRGGKGGQIQLTESAKGLAVEVIDSLELGVVPPDLAAALALPLETILDDLQAANVDVKGRALELLALRMAADAGLLPADMRLRSRETGGAEVDLIAEAAQLHFSRWLFQCKNQVVPVSLSVLAKELGIATLLRAQVIVIVTTGSFAGSVVRFARQAAETTSIQVVLLDGSVLGKYRERGVQGLRDELHRQAQSALTHKRPQLAEVPKEEAGLL
ncbi:MAG: restriction endonuclease [Candidatus Nanopelagicales bacterium]